MKIRPAHGCLVIGVAILAYAYFMENPVIVGGAIVAALLFFAAALFMADR